MTGLSNLHDYSCARNYLYDNNKFTVNDPSCQSLLSLHHSHTSFSLRKFSKRDRDKFEWLQEEIDEYAEAFRPIEYLDILGCIAKFNLKSLFNLVPLWVSMRAVHYDVAAIYLEEWSFKLREKGITPCSLELILKAHDQLLSDHGFILR